MLNKNMDGKMLSQELALALANTVPKAKNVQDMLRGGMVDRIFEKSRGIISIPIKHATYYAWSKDKPSKHGFSFDKRFDFWAESKKGMEGVAFVTTSHQLVLPMYRNDDTVRCAHLESGRIVWVDMVDLMPLFPRAVLASIDPKDKDAFNKFQDHIAKLCDIRTRWLEGKGTYPRNGNLDVNYEGSITPAEQEAVSELENESMTTWATVGRRGVGGNPFAVKKESNPWWVKTPEGNAFITKEMLEKAEVRAKKETIVNSVLNKDKLEGKEDMTKATQVKAGMINVNKEALKQVGYLNAGRASNKLIKESIRPLLNAMFKPTFMQKIAMKLFKMENPVDVALKSGMSDLLCAQMVQAIVEIKGVDNPYVRQVTQAGITQAGYELSKAIPFEDAIDKVVENLEKGAEGIVAKISK
ncbi:hypothetical protein F404_gp095 [Vibrio phage pVp-1]|uniref:Uncharacterized protein n=1 Tax=Vibrio phage pVp-1 TaxID=1150989 RepID=H6WXI6_9CAUD|nr:hypothetical protein F404_gp095 [Vibrio phage pVp-1]AFB83952.1 hypothetical protein pVp-1_0095 [Vibrio phage pVp-1]